MTVKFVREIHHKKSSAAENLLYPQDVGILIYSKYYKEIYSKQTSTFIFLHHAVLKSTKHCPQKIFSSVFALDFIIKYTYLKKIQVSQCSNVKDLWKEDEGSVWLRNDPLLKQSSEEWNCAYVGQGILHVIVLIVLRGYISQQLMDTEISLYY